MARLYLSCSCVFLQQFLVHYRPLLLVPLSLCDKVHRLLKNSGLLYLLDGARVPASRASIFDRLFQAFGSPSFFGKLGFMNQGKLDFDLDCVIFFLANFSDARLVNSFYHCKNLNCFFEFGASDCFARRAFLQSFTTLCRKCLNGCVSRQPQRSVKVRFAFCNRVINFQRKRRVHLIWRKFNAWAQRGFGVHGVS